MRVEFRLFGDVEACVDGRPVDTGHARQRAVLAALLVDVGRPVPADQLIDRVWADHPPYRARNALSAYVSRLRGVLAVDGVQITRGPAGYLLAADPLTVDLHRFRHLVSRARAAELPADAVTLFTRALDLWRGTPFPMIDVPWFADLRHALEAELFAVALDRNDAALTSGRHAELLGEIAAAAGSHPLDERLAGQLMLAQYRSGRQSDALATYQEIRRRLVEELGSEPGPQLRGVHQQILDSGADAPPVRAAPDRPRGNLERRPTRFFGRADDVRRVVDAMAEGPLVTLTGVGGVGKTRLAVETARTAEQRFPDGVWLCELAPLSDGSAVGHAVAATLGVQQQQGLGIEQTITDYLRGRDLLLVVDNCEHLLDAAAGVVDRIVRHCPSVEVLATSREPLGVEGERVVPVHPLPDADAAALFADRARAHRPDFGLDPEGAAAVGAICRRLDGLPLAIELAAARIRAMSPTELAERIDGSRLRYSARGAAPRHQSLVAAIDWSYRLLSEPERVLFARLSLFAGGFDLDGAHGVCADPGTTEDDTLDLLIGLVDKSMVIACDGPGRSRYLVLETLRAYGRERLDEAGLADRFARRHAAHFTALAERGALAVQGADERSWVDRVLPDFDNLRAAFERAVADRDADLALRLVTSLPELAHLRVGYESASWAERTLELADPDHPLFPAAAGAAARGAWNRGDFDRARALAAVAGGRLPGRGTGRVAYPGDVLADVALYEGRADAALRHYCAEVERARRDDDPIRLVWTLYYVAVCHAVLRTPQRGLAAAQEAVRVAEPTGNPTAESMARYALGLVLKKSDPQRALALFDEAGELAASVRNFWWHGIALMEGAATRAVHADPVRACREFLAVLGHWERVGDWSQQWIALRYVARLLARVGAVDAAATLHAALGAADRPSPLDADRLAVELGAERYASASATGAALAGSAVVSYARETLAHHV